MIEKIKNHILLIALILIAIIVCIANYTPGTILSGWDTLHPEFNFGANIKREIFGVFRSNQGLGAVAAHADMADLPHISLLYLFHFFIDRDFLRYFYIFSNLILGAIGMYFFLYKIVLKDKISAFLGGLFYLLNLGTMQQFVVPFEMFTTQYASLPWLFLFATSYLYTKKDSRKLLLFFFIATILSSPMAFAPTLWYVYLFVLISYLFLLAIPQFLKRSFIFSKRALVLILSSVILNLYWSLPNVYYIVSHGSEVSEANINKIFSPQAFLYNKEFGNILDISLLKSFLFDWSLYLGNNSFGQLLSPWIEHLNNPIVLGTGFIFAFITLIGIIKGVSGKNKILVSFVPVLILCLLFLFNDNFPTGGIYNFLNNHVPFFKEAYRFPANKVFGIFTFIYAIFLAQGLMTITQYAKKSKLIAKPSYYALVFVILIIIYMAPAFSGNFISPYMRIKIPKMYFEMFGWFKTKPRDARIANLPIHSIFGWEYYNWHADKPSFQGAGFTWFGIEQSLLNRDFDRWSTYNEQYYKEMSYALYSQNPSLIKATLEKYNIKYILLDKSIVAPQSNPKILFYQEIEKLLENEPYIHRIKDFDNTLIIYEVNLKNDLPRNNNIYTFLNLTDNQGKILPHILSTQNFSVLAPNPVIEKKSIETPQKKIPVNIFSLNYSLKLCDKSDTKEAFGINKEIQENSFSLFAFKNQICMTIPLTSLLKNEKITPESVLGLSLIYKAQAPIGFCLSNLTQDMCADYGSKDDLTSKSESGNVLKYFNLGNNHIENLGITFFLDATSSIYEQKASFENIFVTLTSPISTPQSGPSQTTPTLSLPKAPQLSYSKIRFSKIGQSCEKNSFINPFLENHSSTNTEEHFIEYISEEVLSCDRFSYDIPQNQAYLVLINSRNISGLPLYLCVENHVSKHCDIYASLSSSKDFVTQAFLLPAQIKDAKGYDVIINNFGIKKTLSINDLKSIQILPLLYNPSQTKSEKPKADLAISQSYEKGWKAYTVKSENLKVKNWLNKALPFVFGREIKNHVLVNGWANGWILDDQRPMTNDQRLITVFLPQYLEYFGFALLGGSLVVLAFAYLRKPTE